MSDLLQHIQQEFPEFEQSHLFVACSGGVDSMVLLSLVKQAGFNVTALHMNYHMRAEDSNKDEELVCAFCKQNNINLRVRSNNLKEKLKDGGNLQELARKDRYQWFDDQLSNTPNSMLLLAHHSDDQIETFYLNLARNSGVMGLCAMPTKRGHYIRPLLNFSKEELIDYAKKNNVPWREDNSNAELKYNRNKLRNKIIPELKLAIPNLEESVLTLVQKFQVLQLELENKLKPICSDILKTEFLDQSVWDNLNEFERIELLRQLELKFNMVKSIEELKTTGATILLTDHKVLNAIYKERNGFTFMLENEPATVQLDITSVDRLPNEFNKDSIYLDAQKVEGELSVRKWQIGDRIDSIGVQGSQLISDILKDAKASSKAKANTWVLVDRSGVLACFGYKISRTAIATKDSKEILKVSLIFPEPRG